MTSLVGLCGLSSGSLPCRNAEPFEPVTSGLGGELTCRRGAWHIGAVVNGSLNACAAESRPHGLGLCR